MQRRRCEDQTALERSRPSQPRPPQVLHAVFTDPADPLERLCLGTLASCPNDVLVHGILSHLQAGNLLIVRRACRGLCRAISSDYALNVLEDDAVKGGAHAGHAVRGEIITRRVARLLTTLSPPDVSSLWMGLLRSHCLGDSKTASEYLFLTLHSDGFVALCSSLLPREANVGAMSHSGVTGSRLVCSRDARACVAGFFDENDKSHHAEVPLCGVRFVVSPGGDVEVTLCPATGLVGLLHNHEDSSKGDHASLLRGWCCGQSGNASLSILLHRFLEQATDHAQAAAVGHRGGVSACDVIVLDDVWSGCVLAEPHARLQRRCYALSLRLALNVKSLVGTACLIKWLRVLRPLANDVRLSFSDPHRLVASATALRDACSIAAGPVPIEVLILRPPFSIAHSSALATVIAARQLVVRA